MEYNVNKYKELLCRENAVHNLISRKTGIIELDKHIADSLKALDSIKQPGLKAVDIGTGAGFPGLVLAMARPDWAYTLIESDRKKSQFLMEAGRELGIKSLRVENKRVEELGQDQAFRETFDLCTSRAVATTNILLEYGLPLLREGGRLLLWKGRNYQNELDQAQNALAILGGELEEVATYTLMEEKDRVILIIRKVGVCPDKYPRRTGIPSKRPL